MDLSKIIAAVGSAAATMEPIATTGMPVGKFASYLVAFINALPAIEKGFASAQPFIAAGLVLIASGGKGITDAAWEKQLALLTEQTSILDQQVAKDDTTNG